MRYLLVLICLMALSGCELLVVSEPDTPALTDTAAQEAWTLHNQKLDSIEAWNIDGRISLRLEDEAWHASLLWQQIDQAYHIRLFGPFGAGTILLDGSPQAVVLSQDGEQLHSQDPEKLLSERLGWHVPLNGLRYWAVGKTMPGKPAKMEFNKTGQLATLQQQGWQIRYRRYVNIDGYQLPGKIFMDNQGLDVRIIIDRWQVTGPKA